MKLFTDHEQAVKEQRRKECRCRGRGWFLTDDGKAGLPCQHCETGKALAQRVERRPRHGGDIYIGEIYREPMNWVPPPNRKAQSESEEKA